MQGSLLEHLLAFIVALLLELSKLGLTGLFTNALFLLLTGSTLLGLTEFPFMLLALSLLAELAVTDLLLAERDLLLELTLGVAAALLKLVTTALMKVLSEGLIYGHKSGKTVLKLDIGLVKLLSVLETLSSVLLINGTVAFDLLSIVVCHLLAFLLAVGTLQVVEALASDAELLVNIILLTLKLGELHGTQTVAVQVVNVVQVNVESLVAHLKVSNLFLNLLLADAIMLGLDALGFTLGLLLSESLVFSFLKGLLLEALLAGILLLLAGLELRGLFLALLDDRLACKNISMLLLSASLGAGNSSLASGDAFLVEAGVDIVASGEKGLCQTRELRADNVGRGALKALDATSLSLSRSGSGAALASLGRGENVIVKAQNASGVVHANSKVALLVSVHDELLNGATSDLVRLRELGELLNKVEVNSVVDLRELLEQSGQDDLLQGLDITLHLGILANLGEDRRDLLADGQRVEVHLQNVVEVTDLRADTLKERLGQRIAEKLGTGRSLRHAEKVSQAGVLVLAGFVKVNHGTARSRGADDGDSQSREHNEGGSLLQVSIRSGRVVRLLALARSDNNGRLAQKVVVPRPGSSVEKVVLANKENSGELLVVVGHHDVLGRALAEVEESVDVLNTAESLLPQLQLDGNIQLLKASLKVALQGIGLAQVDGVHLRRVLGSGLHMVTEELAESSELSLACIFEAEIESLGSSALVQDLETSVVAENIEDGTVGLPEELEPRGDDGAVGTVAGLLAGDGSKQDRLGSFAGFQILNVGGFASGSLEAGLDFVGLGLSGSNLFDGEFDELLQDKLCRD